MGIQSVKSWRAHGHQASLFGHFCALLCASVHLHIGSQAGVLAGQTIPIERAGHPGCLEPPPPLPFRAAVAALRLAFLMLSADFCYVHVVVIATLSRDFPKHHESMSEDMMMT